MMMKWIPRSFENSRNITEMHWWMFRWSVMHEMMVVIQISKFAEVLKILNECIKGYSSLTHACMVKWGHRIGCLQLATSAVRSSANWYLQRMNWLIKGNHSHLFIMVHINVILVARVLVHNGAAVNVVPVHILKKINKKNAKFLQTRTPFLAIQGKTIYERNISNLSSSWIQKVETTFFVIEAKTNFNALQGRDWIHSNEYLPSSMH